MLGRRGTGILLVVALSGAGLVIARPGAAGALPRFVHSCGPTRGPVASCAAILRTDVTSAATSISGYHPAGLRSAYGLTTASSNLGTGQTVAVVDAFDDPNAESDL